MDFSHLRNFNKGWFVIKLDDILFWLYLIFISFVSGVMGTIHREEHKEKETLIAKFFLLTFGGATGVLAGYLAGELVFYFTENTRISLASSAFTAWVGAKILIEAQNRILEFIQNYKKENNDKNDKNKSLN